MDDIVKKLQEKFTDAHFYWGHDFADGYFIIGTMKPAAYNFADFRDRIWNDPRVYLRKYPTIEDIQGYFEKHLTNNNPQSKLHP